MEVVVVVGEHKVCAECMDCVVFRLAVSGRAIAAAIMASEHLL